MVQPFHPPRIDVAGLGSIHPSNMGLLFALCMVVLSVFAAQCASVLRGTFTCDNVQVLSDELTRPQAEAYCRYAVWGSGGRSRDFGGQRGASPFGFTSVVRTISAEPSCRAISGIEA